MAAQPAACPHPALANADWLTAPATREALETIEAAGFTARVVGGSVRNALLGEPVSDIDIATDALPHDVMALCAKARLKTIPTGIAHGTVTIIVHAVPFEVTTLRRDVSTDGRHATVAFTGDWAADAGRRDFTINALYCDKRGVLFDPVGGLDDIAHRRIRFIGNAHERIREDYLRILRFFRFSATYAGGRLDAAGLQACLAERAGLAQLSAERIHHEIMKLLVAVDAAAVVEVMATHGLLQDLLGHPVDANALQRLAHLYARHPGEPGFAAAGDDVIRLAALATCDQSDAIRLKQRLRLSNTQTLRIEAALRAAGTIDEMRSRGEATDATRWARARIYQFGNLSFIDGLLVSWARGGTPADDARLTGEVRLALSWPRPQLPISGRDILARGVPSGPRVSQILDQLESWWIDNDFSSDRSCMEAELARLIVVTTT